MTAAACARAKSSCGGRDGSCGHLPRHFARGLGRSGHDHPLPGNADRRHRAAQDGAALRQQEQFRQKLLESFPDLILVVDLEERYTFASSRIRDLLGYRPEELVGKKIEDLQDHSPEFLSLYRDVASGKQLFAASEYGALHRDGSWRTMRASASQFFDSREQAQRRDHFGARHHGRKETRAADHPERTPGGHGADDRRIRARTQQSADHHPRASANCCGRRRTARRGSSSSTCCINRHGGRPRSCRT